MKIVFATGNEGKMKEVRMILADLGLEVLSMKEAGIDISIEEDGLTFEENAVIKAKAVQARVPEAIVLADDSGLEVDYLDRQPGVYSARYLEGTPYPEKNRILIERLKDARGEERSARFVCDIAAVLPDGRVIHAEAAMEGLIAETPAGSGGFGYDPILYLPEYGKTSAELPMEEKNRISHRGKALKRMEELLKNVLEERR